MPPGMKSKRFKKYRSRLISLKSFHFAKFFSNMGV